MKGWKLVQLKQFLDTKIFKMYGKAERETESFIFIGSKEDEEQLAKMF
jgi:hypothetical protein